jgi:hypothetical protein
MEGTRSRSIRLAVAVPLTLVAAIGASTATTVAQADPSASPVIHGWPGSRGEPAGLYSWTVGDHVGWMHGLGDGVAITIRALDADGTYTTDVSPEDWAADPPYLEHPVKVTEEVSQTWLLDVGDTRVRISISSDPDADPAIVAEAVAVVESITVQPTEDGGGQRLVFRLGEGWDSG